MSKKDMNNEVVDNQEIPQHDGCGCETCAPDAAGAGNDNVADESFENGDNMSSSADEAEQWKDKYLRLVAEFDNYRKRTVREKGELINYGGEEVIKSVLAVIDDIDRALDSVHSARDLEAVKEGIVLIHNKLTGTLKARGVNEIQCIGNCFDTDLHEAVAKMPVQDDMKGKIIDVVQKGYMLNDKIVRFAKVVVGE